MKHYEIQEVTVEFRRASIGRAFDRIREMQTYDANYDDYLSAEEFEELKALITA